MVLKGRYEIVYLVVPLVILAFLFANHFNIVGMGGISRKIWACITIWCCFWG